MSAMSKSHVVEALEELECGMRKIVATEALSLFIHLRRALGMPDVLLDTNFSIYARSASLRSPRVTPQPLRFMEAHSLQSVTPPLSSADASPAGSIDRQRAEMESLIMAARSSVGPGNSYVSNRHRRRKPVGEQQNDSAADVKALARILQRVCGSGLCSSTESDSHTVRPRQRRGRACAERVHAETD
jgi:hypothetical protein